MHLPFLSPYLRGVGSNFEHGVNFAVGGSTATNFTLMNPFHLSAQYGWFQEFRDSVQAAQASGNSRGNPDLNIFKDGLYVIESGGNDYNYAYLNVGITRPTILSVLVPAVVQAISDVANKLLEGGARHMIIFNIPPQGCAAAVLTTNPGLLLEYDQYGCHTRYNSIAEAHNTQLRQAVDILRGHYTDATIVYADLYAFVRDVQRDPSAHGFQQQNLTHACCGAGGAYNYNPPIRCGQTGLVAGQLVHAGPCPHPNLYTQWDGVHFTEAFNHAAARAIFAGKFINTPNTAGFPFTCSG